MISIIGAGGMAGAIGRLAAKAGHSVDVASRDSAKASALAQEIGLGAVAAEFGAAPAGDFVVLAVPYGAVLDVVAHYGDALAGKILIDITNPFNADGSGLVTTAGNSMSQQIAAAAPDGTHVVKAFNSIFGHVIRSGHAPGCVPRRRQCRGEGAGRRVSRKLGHAAARRRRARHGPRT